MKQELMQSNSARFEQEISRKAKRRILELLQLFQRLKNERQLSTTCGASGFLRASTNTQTVLISNCMTNDST